MSAQHGSTWFWSDWLGDQAVRRLTPAERGIWIDLLALAAVGSPTGYVCDEKGRPISEAELARVCNATPQEVAEHINGILEKGAASRDRTGRLFNRRMVRDAQKAAKKEALSAKRASAGRVGGDHTAMKYFRNPILPQHLPQHVPRQTLDTIPIPSIKTSSFPVAARATPSASGIVDSHSGPSMKRVSDLSRAEVEEAIKRRNTLAK